MAKLVLSSGGVVVHQSFIDKERVDIGREADNAFVVDDPAVAPKHASIVAIGNDHIVEDRQSGVGTFVNGTRVSRHILQHGDVIQLGSFHLRYLNPRASAEVDFERTMLITGLQGVSENDLPRSEPAGETPRPLRRPSVRFPVGRVRVAAGLGAGEVIVLDRVITTVGRAGDELAVITRRPRGFFLTHVEGRRHARVNGQSIGLEARPLHQGDVIEVADAKLELVLD